MMFNVSRNDSELLRKIETLPSAVQKDIEAILRFKKLRWIGKSFGFFYFALSFIAFTLLSSEFHQYAEAKLEKLVQITVPITTQIESGIGVFLGYMVIFFSGIWVFPLFIRIAPMPLKGAVFINSNYEADKWISQFHQLWSTPEPYNRPSDFADAINRTTSKQARELGSIWLLIASLLGAVGWNTLGTFEVVAEDGFYNLNGLSKQLEHHRWSEVRIVRLGCNQNGRTGDLIYAVEFEDGDRVSLPDAESLNKKHWLTNLEAIDAQVTAASPEFKRWKNGDREPLHPKCLRGFYAEIGIDQKDRIDNLLRIGQFPEDARPNP